MDSHSQNQTQNRNVVRRYTDECWNQGKTEVINEIFADNVRLHDPVFPHLTAGARSLRTHVETCRAAFPDIHFTVDDTICERNEVVNHWTAQGTHKGNFLGVPPTNRKASITGTSIYKLESGKIVEQWSHWNLMSMMEQLGVAANMAQAGTAAEKQKA